MELKRRRMFRGDTLTFPFQVVGVPAGAPPGTTPAPISIGGWYFWFTVKNNRQDPDNQAIVQQTTDLNGGVTITNINLGTGSVTMPPIATFGFPDTLVEVFYDIQGKDIFGNITTIEKGVIEVDPDITRSTTQGSAVPAPTPTIPITAPPQSGFIGTGFVHVQGGVFDPAAKAVNLGTSDVMGALPPQLIDGSGASVGDILQFTGTEYVPSPLAMKASLIPAPYPDNLFLWVSPDSIVSVPATPLTPGATSVLRWADKSGLAQDFVQATPTRQPFLSPVANSFLPGVPGVQTGPEGAGRWLVSNPVSTDLAGDEPSLLSTSLYFLVQPLADGVAGTRTMVGLSNSSELDRFEFPIGSGNVTPVLVYPLPATQAIFSSFIQQPVLFCIVGDATHQTLFANGVQVAQAASAPGNWTEMVLGTTSTPLDAESTPNIFFEIIAYNVSHVISQRRFVESYFTNKYGVQIVFDGNSQFKGDHSSGLGTSIPGYAPHLVATLAQFWTNYINNGTNGITTPNLTARMAGTTGPLFNPLSSRRGIVFLEMENDISMNGANIDPNNTSYAATAWANVIAYSRAARAAGVTAITACSCLPIGPLIPPPNNYENTRQAANALLRANWNATDPQTGLPYFDGFADIGGPLSPVGSVASTQNPALYDPADQTHLNDGGVRAACALITPAIQTAFLGK